MDVDGATAMSASPIEGDEYCRAVESYLCRRNEGHLVRIVGPAFEMVCTWGAQGMPLKVVYRGIDRYLERYYAKVARRRPVRIEFCEADVLDVFDAWRRAVGVMHVRETPASDGAGDATDVEDTGRHRGSLKSHLERAAVRVGALRAGSHPLDDTLADVEQTLGDMLATGTFRGEARERAIARLRTLDESLSAAARSQCDDGMMARLVSEAEGELAPFRARMTGEAYQQSLDACVARLVREQMRLPVLIFD